MEEIVLIAKLIISAFLGALIGLERERKIQEEKNKILQGSEHSL